MLRSREALPAQIAKLHELGRETRSGSFGEPTRVYDWEKGKIATYHLVHVMPVSYIRDPATFSGDADDRTVFAHVGRVFNPSLELAMGFRNPGDSHYQSEVHEAERQALRDLTYDPEYLGQGVESIPGAEGQFFPSYYGASIDRFVTDVGIDDTAMKGPDGSEWIEIEYEMRKKDPAPSKNPHHHGITNPSYKHSLSIWEDSTRVSTRVMRSVEVGPKTFYKHSSSILTRGHADLIKADLERIRADYFAWLRSKRGK